MLKPAFIDLSHHNTIPQSLQGAVEDGILGVVHKATEGLSYVDEKLAARWSLANDVGMLWGVYHFIRPGSIADQVDHFLTAIADCSDEDTLLALDWEDTAVSLDDAVLFMRTVEENTGRSPVLYSGHVLKEALGGEADERINCYRLWLAQYASAPTLPPGWESYWAWQYTDSGSVTGINPPVDLNAYEGTAGDLASDWSGSAVVVPPEPEPEPDELEVIVVVPPGVSVRVITQSAARTRARRW